MKNIILILSLFFPLVLHAEGEPDFDGLMSDRYEDRARAQESFLAWIVEDQKLALQHLLKIYLVSEDPELSARILLLMERAYFPPQQGYLGINMDTSRGGIFRRGAPQDGPKVRGIKIIAVVPGTPAAAAGLQAEDLIVAIDDWKVEGSVNLNNQLAEKIQSKAPGSKILLGIEREGKAIEIPMHLGILPVPSVLALNFGGRSERFPKDLLEQLLGFSDWLTLQLAKRQKI